MSAAPDRAWRYEVMASASRVNLSNENSIAPGIEQILIKFQGTSFGVLMYS